MRRGTTPTHTFTIPSNINMDTIDKVQIIYSQNNAIILCKDTQYCKIYKDDRIISVELAQDETLLFNHKIRAEIQVRLVTKDNKALLSDIIIIGVEKCLSDEVLQ